MNEKQKANFDDEKEEKTPEETEKESKKLRNKHK
jgi:hypothetical protein